MLRRFLRDNGTQIDVEQAAKKLDLYKQEVLNADNMELLRGIEGRAANVYFGVFNHLIINQKNDFVLKVEVVDLQKTK